MWADIDRPKGYVPNMTYDTGGAIREREQLPEVDEPLVIEASKGKG